MTYSHDIGTEYCSRLSVITAVHSTGQTCLRIMLLGLLALLLAACGSPFKRPVIPALPQQPPSEQLASDLTATGNLAQAAQIYEALAQIETDPFKQIDYQLSLIHI